MVVGGVFLGALIAFAYMASVHDYFPGDVAASSWVQSWRMSWLETAMRALSPDHRVVTAPLVVLAALVLFIKGMRREGGLILLVALTSFITVQAIKAAIARPRPSADLVQVFEQSSGYSFPSGHVTHYVAFLGTLAFILSTRIKGSLTRGLVQGFVAVLLLSMGLSRIYLGAHWPSDVVAGYVVGAAVAAAGVWAMRWWSRSREQARS